LLNLNQGPVWEKYGADWGGVYQQMPVMKKKFEKVFYSEKKGAMCKKGERRWKI
jgi:hypothetical protein